MSVSVPPPDANPDNPSQSFGNNLTVAGGQVNQFQAQQINQRNYNTYNTHNVNTSKDGFERLLAEVASAAFHNSAQRIDPPRCHPNTREEAMRKIMQWIVDSNDFDAWIMWLNGAAGAGKTAIVQSIAELCVKRGIVVASFFFFRTDPTRNTIRPLIATLAYQITLNIPETRSAIVSAIDHNPLIFEQSLADQIDILILDPLRRSGHFTPSISPLPILLVIDGLDECTDHGVQTNIIRTLSDSLAANKRIPLRLLVASRPESHLSAVFNSQKVLCGLTRLALNADEMADDDIRLFLTDKFAEIRATHPLNHLLNPNWPSPSVIDKAVEKSSGQFIYAAVMINYVSSPQGHPAQRLDVIDGVRPARLDTPFAQLDALYSHIFSQVPDLKITLTVLAMALCGVIYVPFADPCLGCGPGGVESSLSSLTSLVIVAASEIKFLHASLPDFLRDEERSRQYHINLKVWATDLAILWFQAAQRQDYVHLTDLTAFLEAATPSQELRTYVLNFVLVWKYSYLDAHENSFVNITEFLSAVKSLDFGDHGSAYRHQCASIRQFIQSNCNRISEDNQKVMRTTHDIHDIHILTGSTMKKLFTYLWRRIRWWMQVEGGDIGMVFAFTAFLLCLFYFLYLLLVAS